MRKLTLAFFCCVFLSALFPRLAQAQGAQTQFNQDFITSTQCVAVPSAGFVTGSYAITGGWTGTLTAYGIVGQGTRVALASQTANGSYVTGIAGYTLFEVCGNTVASGSAFVQVYSSISSGSGASLGSTIKGGSIVGNGLGGVTTSSNCIDATTYIVGLQPGQDYGPAINLMTTLFPNSCIDLRGLPNKVYLNSAMVTPACTNYPTCSTGGAFSGTILLGYTVFFINSGTGLQTFGSGVNVIGEGRTNSAGAVSYVAGTGTRFELCGTDTAAGDFTTYCGSTAYSATLTSDGNNYPAVITMNGYLPSVGAVGVSGTTLLAVRISGISVGCSMIANATAFANLSAQEGSKFDNFYGTDCSGAGDIGLSMGGGTGGAQNSWATDFQFSTLSGRTNAASAVCVQVWGGTGNGMPSKIDKGSCVNNSVVGTLPNYAFQYVGGTTNIGEMLLEANHWESAAVCGVCVGVVTVKGVDQGGAANGLTVIDDNCGPGFGNGALSACYRLFSTANLAGAAVTNFQVLGSEATGAGAAPLNLIGDDNNLVIPIATKFVARYETDGTAAGGKVISDTSGTNATNFAGFVQSDGGAATAIKQNDAWRQTNYSNATTTASTFASYTFPALARHYSVHCGGTWHEAGTTDGIVVSVIFNTAPTQADFGATAAWNTSTTTAVIAAGGKSGIAVTTSQVLVTTGLANASGAEYPLSIDGGVEVAAGGTTMSFQAAATVGTTPITISRDFYCAIQP